MSIEEQFKKELKEAVEHMTGEKEFYLVRYWFGSIDKKCACPLGCLIAKDGSPIEGGKVIAQIKERYNELSDEWLGSFLVGYDGLHKGEKLEDLEVNKDAFAFGEEIYTQFKDKVKTYLE